MALPDRKMLLGLALGVLCAAIGPGAVVAAIADEPRTGIDPNGLVKFADSLYDVHYDDAVDTTPTAKNRVKKVEFGRVSYVDITTTATGTYSSDALFSNNIQYPGITVNEMWPDTAGAIYALGSGGNWTLLSLVRGQSFVHIRSRNHATISGNGVTCIFTQYTTSC